jgi:hypothetical protein
MSSKLTVPKNNCTRLPSSSELEVSTLLNMSVKKLKESIRFFLLETDNASTELSIYEESLFAGHRMLADERVGIFDRLALDDTASCSLARIFGLCYTGVNYLESLEELSKRWRESLVGGAVERGRSDACVNVTDEKRTSTHRWSTYPVSPPDGGLS